MRWLDRWRARRASSATGLACRELMARLTEYLEGAMSPADVARVDAHLRGCDGCVEAVDQFRRTIAVAGSLQEADLEVLDPALRDELLAAFRAEHGSG